MNPISKFLFTILNKAFFVLSIVIFVKILLDILFYSSIWMKFFYIFIPFTIVYIFIDTFKYIVFDKGYNQKHTFNWLVVFSTIVSCCFYLSYMYYYTFVSITEVFNDIDMIYPYIGIFGCVFVLVRTADTIISYNTYN